MKRAKKGKKDGKGGKGDWGKGRGGKYDESVFARARKEPGGKIPMIRINARACRSLSLGGMSTANHAKKESNFYTCQRHSSWVWIPLHR